MAVTGPFDGEFWFCESKGEAWDVELHDETPCQQSIRLWGDSPGEHSRCGPCEVTPTVKAAV